MRGVLIQCAWAAVRFDSEMSVYYEEKKERLRRSQLAIIKVAVKLKWLAPCLSVREESLANADQITFVMDREGDIMEVYDRLPNDRTDVLVRAMHNLNIVTPERKRKVI